MPDLRQLHEQLTERIVAERQRDMAEAIAGKREQSRRAEARAARATQALEKMGLEISNLQALDRELSAEAEAETLKAEARMNELSQKSVRSEALDLETALLPTGAVLLTPVWVAAFADLDVQSEQTEARALSPQAVLSGGACQDYYNWAKGAGSGLFGSGEGKLQSWVDFGFWFRPSATRFYSVQPLFRFRGFVIVRADDGLFTSKFARASGSAWTNVYQYTWKGWNSVDVYNIGDDNINVERRQDIDRRTYNSYLLAGGDWAFIRCTLGLWAYARGSGSYAKNDFSTGNANFLCVPNVIVA